MIQLIANPEKYDGKFVRVIGFVNLGFEGNLIFLHENDFKHGIGKNALWLTITEQIKKESAKYHHKYMIVEGTFDAKHLGHMGLASGSIKNIKRFDVWFIKFNVKGNGV